MYQKTRQNQLSPRKQATHARAASTVDAIVESAARKLEHAGFEGYTTEAVARRAGVGIGLLYQYFPEKDAVTVVLIERETVGILLGVAQAVADPDWRQALAAMVRAAVTQRLRRPRLARLLDIEEWRGINPALEKRVADILFSAVSDVLGRSGLVSSDCADTAASDVERRISRAILACLEQGFRESAV